MARSCGGGAACYRATGSELRKADRGPLRTTAHGHCQRINTWHTVTANHAIYSTDRQTGIATKYVTPCHRLMAGCGTLHGTIWPCMAPAPATVLVLRPCTSFGCLQPCGTDSSKPACSRPMLCPILVPSAGLAHAGLGGCCTRGATPSCSVMQEGERTSAATHLRLQKNNRSTKNEQISGVIAVSRLSHPLSHH